MREITARAIVKTDDDGHYYLDVPNPKWWSTEIGSFAPETAVVITVKKWYKKRSVDQNSTYHWYIGVLADCFGYAPDTMKSLIALKWLKQPLYDNLGNEMRDVTTGDKMFELRSSASLNTVEMADLCMNIRQWADEGWGVILTEPDKNYKINFK